MKDGTYCPYSEVAEGHGQAQSSSKESIQWVKDEQAGRIIAVKDKPDESECFVSHCLWRSLVKNLTLSHRSYPLGGSRAIQCRSCTWFGYLHAQAISPRTGFLMEQRTPLHHRCPYQHQISVPQSVQIGFRRGDQRVPSFPEAVSPCRKPVGR